MKLTAFALSMRLVLFGAFQAFIALLLAVGGVDNPWTASTAWWPVAASATSVVTFIFLRSRARAEGFSLAQFYRPVREGWGRDVLVAVGVALLAAVFAAVGSVGLGVLLLGDPTRGSDMLSQPLPLWAAVPLLIVLPATIALTELPLYFGYVQPRLRLARSPRWMVIALPAVFLSLQHATVPLVFDPAFMVWRALMFVGFAVVFSWALLRRPRLMPYLIAVHFLLDLQTAIMILLASK